VLVDHLGLSYDLLRFLYLNMSMRKLVVAEVARLASAPRITFSESARSRVVLAIMRQRLCPHRLSANLGFSATTLSLAFMLHPDWEALLIILLKFIFNLLVRPRVRSTSIFCFFA